MLPLDELYWKEEYEFSKLLDLNLPITRFVTMAELFLINNHPLKIL